jgi:hypothetical protein
VKLLLAVADTFKDDGFSAFKEITRDDFVRLIGAIERGELDVVIVRHGVLSPYMGGDLDPEGSATAAGGCGSGTCACTPTR